MPAVITQYEFGVATIILGLTGHTAAAAVTGVTTRLLTGLQGVNGVAVAALFPRLASRARGSSGDQQARLAGVGIVALSISALLVVAASAPFLGRIFLDSDAAAVTDAMVVGIGGAAACGLVMHLTFALVARGLERGIPARSSIGAAVTTLGASAAAIIGGDSAAGIAMSGFVVGQVLTLVLLLGIDRPAGVQDVVSTPLALAAGLVAPVAAVAGVVAGALGVIVVLAVAGLAMAVHLDTRRKRRRTEPFGSSAS